MNQTIPMILFTGFLGSGKTTLLLETVKYLSVKQFRCAIIVNEVGEIGIDNLQMKKLGYDVWELFGGCICCTLNVNLESTLKKLADYDVDVILTEPSGAAEPSGIFHSLLHCGYERSDIYYIYILDAPRIGMLTQVLEPLITASLPPADMVLINKTDQATSDEIDLCSEIIRKRNQEAAVLRLTLNEPIPAKLTDSFDFFLKGR